MNCRLKKILLFIIICCAVFCYTFFFSNLFNDEIWNYGFGYNIVMGLVPYRDFNMIIPPFYSFVVALFILLFGHHLWSIHILNAIVITTMLFMIYRNIGSKVLLFLPFILLYTYPGYNLFSLFLIIIIITICDKNIKEKDIIMGGLCSILILTKQSIGLCVLIPTIYYSKNKLKALFSCMIPIFLFVLYLIYNSALFEFIDYCFLSLFDFSNSNKIILFLPLEIIICLFLIYRLIRSKGYDKKAFYVLMYQIITIPICDDYHFMVGFMSVWYYLLYILDIKKFKIKYYFVMLLFSTIYWNCLVNGYEDYRLYDDPESYLYGRYVEQFIQDSVNIISDYMEKVKKDYDNIYLFTKNSYLIKMNTSYTLNKYDLINNGNMGYQGSLRYIREIKNHCLDKSCLFILYRYEVDRDNLKANQTNLDILNFIYDNYEYYEEIDVFDIYIS